MATLEDINKVGAFICALRKEKGLTQKQLAEQIHVTDKAISKWERGMGYPDVTNLTLLAEALGVTVGELLQGKSEEPPTPQAEALVKTTLVYADRASRAKRATVARWTMLAYSALALIGIFVCVLCDYVITGAISWSVIPVGSLVFTWLLLAPLLLCKKHPIAKALLALTVLILPFLYLLEQSVSLRGWFVPIAIPITLISLAFLWVLCLLFSFTRINRWYLSAFAVMLIPFVDFGADYTVSVALQEPLVWVYNVLSLLVCILAAGVLVALGVRRKRRRSVQAVS